MPRVVGIRFNTATKVYYFDPAGQKDLAIGEYAVVETSRGEEVGKVVISPTEVSDDEIVGKLKRVQRRASSVDLMQIAYYRYREESALQKCREMVQDHGLPMKVIRAEYNYDGSRLVFFFTAEKRVDFRKLVQDLAKAFKSRIELRQVGVRDEAKLIGGMGRCGRQLCCSTWLTDFSPVSIRMAKQQDLPLSPMEISGLCGRLLCCLAYENEQYRQAKNSLPRRGSIVETPQGKGRVTQVNVIKESVSVELEGQTTIDVTQEELQQVSPKTPAPDPSPTPTKRRRRGKRKRRRSKS